MAKKVKEKLRYADYTFEKMKIDYRGKLNYEERKFLKQVGEEFYHGSPLDDDTTIFDRGWKLLKTDTEALEHFKEICKAENSERRKNKEKPLTMRQMYLALFRKEAYNQKNASRRDIYNVEKNITSDSESANDALHAKVENDRLTQYEKIHSIMAFLGIEDANKIEYFLLSKDKKILNYYVANLLMDVVENLEVDNDKKYKLLNQIKSTTTDNDYYKSLNLLYKFVKYFELVSKHEDIQIIMNIYSEYIFNHKNIYKNKKEIEEGV